MTDKVNKYTERGRNLVYVRMYIGIYYLQAPGIGRLESECPSHKIP